MSNGDMLSKNDPLSKNMPINFIRQIIEEDISTGKHSTIVTRFPPEPNGYLHIGHAKSICLNFGIAERYNGKCTLRFDDTNPVKEDAEFVCAIKEDIRWLGFKWSALAHASDYFSEFYQYAIQLIEKNLAYVDSSSAEEIRKLRGTLTSPGENSAYRERAIAENLELFARMKAGEFADGEHVLRAKIDMASPNINLRDPVLYRIRHHSHQRTGDEWCIYPMYDFAHGQGDAIEGVTHSLCTLEFQDHRVLYDWFIQNITTPSQPRQIEFSRMNLDYTVMSKRLLTQLVEEKHVNGWDDPRMPTISGLRRRGYTAQSIRNFIDGLGITKKQNIIELTALENAIREDLDRKAPRAMAVLRPLKVVIENLSHGEEESFDAPNHPGNAAMGSRKIILTREIYIEQADYMDDPPKKFFRLGPDREVRLRYAFVIRCTDIIRDENGVVVELRCQYDPQTRHGKQPEGRKVKGIIHWVSAQHSQKTQIRLYDRLFLNADPLADKSKNFLDLLNPESLEILENARMECGLSGIPNDIRYQFERLGYFFADKTSTQQQPIFNRIVTLRDTWAKISR